MMGVLDDLTASSLAAARVRQAKVSQEELEAALDTAVAALDPLPSFADSSRGIRIIAEVKRSSPSKGALATIDDPGELAQRYRDGGAAAISVLTEATRFGGSLADLVAVRAAVGIPLLRKDFISSRYQLLEARVAGADLALLIVAALDNRTLRDLFDYARQIGLTPLVEVHTADETRRAVDLGAPLIGVNNRNLQTLAVDIHQFGRLAELIPSGVVKVAESGLLTLDDVRMVHEQGANVVLVGEALVRDRDPEVAIARMLDATQPHFIREIS